ncbi:MAG TPA: metallophosphoesterase [Vicinamibacterales bacterium]|jgi:hypothetical protein
MFQPRTLTAVVAAALMAAGAGLVPRAQTTFRFAVSGDSRDCGDVVMPEIAAGAQQDGAAFYWHLGDFRKIYDFDEDMQHEVSRQGKPLTILDYENGAWDDFIAHQLAPFGSTPVYLAVGNHELYPPKTRGDLIAEFADWFNAPEIRRQRLADDPSAYRVQTWSHWVQAGVDFISLDNGSIEQFEPAQMRWVHGVLARDEQDPAIKTIVVGMHRALPESLSADHSMNESPAMRATGREVYETLLHAQNVAHKHVYLVASHSHYYMDDTFNTAYWREHGGVLPGWIVGTAGAYRYTLPADAKDAKMAETHVYGYLLGEVAPDGTIAMRYHRIDESDVPPAVANQFTPGFVHWCFAENAQTR